jgi:hypothetical protein
MMGFGISSAGSATIDLIGFHFSCRGGVGVKLSPLVLWAQIGQRYQLLMTDECRAANTRYAHIEIELQFVNHKTHVDYPGNEPVTSR